MGFNTDLVWQVLKWAYVLAFGLYFIFSVVVFRQVQLMNRTLNGVLELPLRIVSLGFMVISGVVLAAAIGGL